MRKLELTVPPVIVALACGALMYAMSRIWPSWHWNSPASRAIGAVVALVGVALILLGVLSFHRARTTVDPLHPSGASSIVQSGVYRYTRNPMYLGMLLILGGYGLYLSHSLAFLLLPAFAAYMTRFQIIPEERILRDKFGQAYSTYASRVRRWI